MQSLLPAVAAACAQFVEAITNPRIGNASRNKKNVVLRATLNFRFEMNTCCPIFSEVRGAFFLLLYSVTDRRPAVLTVATGRRILTMANCTHLSIVNNFSKWWYTCASHQRKSKGVRRIAGRGKFGGDAQPRGD